MLLDLAAQKLIDELNSIQMFISILNEAHEQCSFHLMRNLASKEEVTKRGMLQLHHPKNRKRKADISLRAHGLYLMAIRIPDVKKLNRNAWTFQPRSVAALGDLPERQIGSQQTPWRSKSRKCGKNL